MAKSQPFMNAKSSRPQAVRRRLMANDPMVQQEIDNLINDSRAMVRSVFEPAATVYSHTGLSDGALLVVTTDAVDATVFLPANVPHGTILVKHRRLGSKTVTVKPESEDELIDSAASVAMTTNNETKTFVKGLENDWWVA